MNWTREAPKEKGYYWYRSARMSSASIVHVFRYNAGEPWFMNFTGDHSDLPLREDMGAEWYGPLREPSK
jgi:hypothetical protein